MKHVHKILFLVVGFCFAATAVMGAQDLVKKNALTLDLAKTIADAAQKKAKELGYSVAIAIRDEGGNIALVYRMNDAGVIALKWAEAKSLTAFEYRQGTASGEFRIWNIGDQTMVLGVSGGAPLMVDSQIVGSIGISGAKGKTDDIIAEAGVAALNDILKNTQATQKQTEPQAPPK